MLKINAGDINLLRFGYFISSVGTLTSWTFRKENRRGRKEKRIRSGGGRSEGDEKKKKKRSRKGRERSGGSE